MIFHENRGYDTNVLREITWFFSPQMHVKQLKLDPAFQWWCQLPDGFLCGPPWRRKPRLRRLPQFEIDASLGQWRASDCCQTIRRFLLRRPPHHGERKLHAVLSQSGNQSWKITAAVDSNILFASNIYNGGRKNTTHVKQTAYLAYRLQFDI